MASSSPPRSPAQAPPDLAQYSFLSTHERHSDASSSSDEEATHHHDRIQDEDGGGDDGTGAVVPPSPHHHHQRHASLENCRTALWEEDSPYFAEWAHDSLQETKELCSGSIKELVKGMKDLCKATTAMVVASQTLARANKKAANRLADAATLSTDGDMEVVPLLHRFANTLEEMASAHETLVHSMTQSFVVPLEAFSAQDIAQAAEQEKAYHQEKHAFTDTLGKLLRGPLKPSAKVPPATALATRARDVGQARRGMEHARHRLAHTVDTLETRRTLEITEGVAAVLHAYKAHHHMLMDTLGTLGPSLDALQASQNKAREGLNDAQGKWERRAEMLEMLLPTEVAERRLDAGDEARFAQLHTLEAASSTTLSTPLLDLVDRKFAVLEVQTSLRTFFSPRAAPGVHYESYLHMRVPTKGLASTTATHTWIRRWFVLEGSSLYFVRESSHDPQGSDGMVEGSSERSLVCDVVLSSVREVPSTGNLTGPTATTSTDPNAAPPLPYCLEIFSANRKAVVLQAEGPADYQGWIQALRRRIERLLVGGEGMALGSGPSSPARSKSPVVSSVLGSLSPRRVLLGSSTLNHSRATSPVPTASDAASVAQDREHYPPKILEDPVLHQLTEANPTCADCEAPYPDWVSLNLGVVVCLQCSGVHRSLGVHVSKVRSLALDDLDSVDLRLLGKLGNARVNAVYEHTLLDGWFKPKADAPRATREQYIKAKYVWKGFTPVPASGATPDTHAHALVEAALANDLGAALAALAKGADVNWVGGNDKGQTALHVSARRGDSVVEAVAFLVQNGGHVGLRDRDDLTALDLATQGHHGETVRYLLKY